MTDTEAIAQTMETKNEAEQKEPKDICNQFFDLVLKLKVIDAYDELTNGTLLEETASEGLVEVKKRTLTFLSDYGEILGYELIKVKPLGKSLQKLYFNLLTERFPILFFFSFYKGKSDWEVLSLNVVDDHYNFTNSDIL